MKNKRRKRAIFILSFLTFLISGYLIYNIIDVLRYRSGNPDEVIYKSSVHSDIGYDVYLKPNDFFDQVYVGNDFSYISSLVEYIKTSFNYNYEGTNSVDISYDYYIKGQMVTNYMAEGANSLTKPLWIKEFTLLDRNKGHSSNSKITIKENLNIGLDYYNELLEDFRTSTNMVLDSRLDVTLVIRINGELVGNKTLTKEHYLTMSIPLGVKAFDVTISKSYPEHEVIYSKEQLKLETSYMLAIIYIVILLAVLWGAIYLIKLIINKDKNDYESKINKLLKDYDDRIVTVSSYVRYERMEIVNVKNFAELLNLSDETLEPIIFWEKNENDLREAWFSVIKDRILYRYIITYKNK